MRGGVATLDELGRYKIVAVLREIPLNTLIPLADALVTGGIKFLEVTFGSQDTIGSIQSLRDRFQKSAYVGAGTVLNSEMAELALQAGAQFLLSPGMNQAKGIIRVAHEHGVIAIPGAMTPTEIQQAVEWGADAVKIFPASTLGPDYVRHVVGPFSDVKLIPTGGLNRDNISGFLRAGAFAVGVGGSLVSSLDRKKGDYKSIVDTAHSYASLVLDL